jgi:hypothetical protein
MKTKNKTSENRENKEDKLRGGIELEKSNRKRELQNKVLKKIVENLNEQKKVNTYKSKKK